MDNQNHRPFRGRGYFRYRGRGRGWKKNQDCSAPAKLPKKSSSQTDSFTLPHSPYPGWKLYFPHDGYIENSLTCSNIKTFENLVTKNCQLFNASTVEETLMFIIDFKLLLGDNEFLQSWQDNFVNDLQNNPEHTLLCLGLAMHQYVLMYLKDELKEEATDLGIEHINLPLIRARVINFEPLMQFKHLKTNCYGKLVTIRGTIIRVGSIKLLCTWMAFECNSCKGVTTVRQSQGDHTLPETCNSDLCRSRSFTPLLGSPYTQTINWQSVRLQEIAADEMREGGRVPRTVDCELMADLVDTCSPGDLVTITGIVKVRNEDDSKKKSGNIFLLYVEAVSVTNAKSQSGSSRSPVEFNMKDYYAIKEIHAEPQLFRLLVNSLCPTIFGHELVKAGLLFCLVGGCQKQMDGRADPHILVVGDPGLGKSRMLQACANVTPRGVYVCGNTSTSSGLTVTLKREGGGDYALEAGALVLSDQGCCCIDEFDKMTNQHQALLEAMEQQTISIAKAGVVCSLPARTSILAAANPVGGHYNKAKTVSENLRLGPALLSRFDLVFILLDQPNVYLDCRLSEHVMALHSKVQSNVPISAISLIPPTSNETILSRDSLKQRLKLNPGEEVDTIPHQLLRKYIAYARKYVKPRVSPEAAKVLQQFYLELRRHQYGADCTPVTTRQLESMVRLTEARAKLELRDTATVDDAYDTIEIMKASMMDTWSDDVGTLDLSRSLHGSGMSSRNQAKKFIAALQRIAEQKGRSKFPLQELKDIAKAAQITVPDFSNFLSTLNVQGFLLKKGPQMYQLLSAD